jgi:hypothetical protein
MRHSNSVRRRPLLRLEPLESRHAPAILVGGARVTYQDADGDAVTVTFSKPILTAANVNTVFTFDSGTVSGSNAARQQLRQIVLGGIGAPAAGAAITVTAVRSAVNGGDGFAAVGQVAAGGIDLGPVIIDGDLGSVRAGDADLATSGLKGLTVQSLGLYGTTTGAKDLRSSIAGRLDFLRVRTDVVGASADADGIGSVLIGGSLIGGRTGKGTQASGVITSRGDLGPVTIRGDLIGGDAEGSHSGEVFAKGRLARLTLGGSLLGGTGVGSGLIEVDGEAGAISIAGSVIGANATGTSSVGYSGVILAKRIATLTIGGSLIAGTNAGTGTIANSGAVRVADDLGAVLVKGSLIGSATNPVVISARGQAVPTATADVAIKSLRVLGRVQYAQIVAGVDQSGAAANADAQIGPVVVGGNWVASSLVAGAVPGPDGLYGDADDVKMSGTGVRDAGTITSKIAGLTVGGSALGTFGGTDHFGVVAEWITSFKVGGTTIPVFAGTNNDNFAVGPTGDFSVKEV